VELAGVTAHRTAPVVAAEQLIYARWLAAGTMIGLALLAAAFLVYSLGIVEPHIPHEDLPELWTLPLEEYLDAAEAPLGWNWLLLVDKGDFMNFIGIGFLALVSVLCYVRILAEFVARRDRLYAAIALLQLLVLLTVASGLVGAGH
jgi:predicted membrane-bound spermidine synthase